MNDNTRPTLWIISELYYPEETSTGYYMTHIAEGLAKAKHSENVGVICGQPNYSARGKTSPKFEEHKNVRIYRCASTRLDKNVVPFRLLNMLTLSCSIFFKALRRIKRGDRMLVVTTPPTLPFIAAVAALIKGASFTLLIHDNYPEILVAVNKTREDSFAFRVLSFANRWLYKYAAKIIVVGRDMIELVAKKTAGLDVPIAFISNWAETDDISPASRDDNPLLKELSLNDKFVFLYAGNMGYPNDVESILECAKRLKDEPIQFVFLGAGVKRKAIVKAVEDGGLTNVTMLDPRPRAEQQTFLNACDVALVSLVGKMWGVSMPSRTYNILAAGKPILAITDEGSELALIVEEENVGWTTTPENAEKLLETIRRIVGERDTLGEMGIRARRAAIEKYSEATAIARYAEELAEKV
jgi:glycosyltransferase involved in cell wall biosynthesis